jgi:hypothetical protein
MSKGWFVSRSAQGGGATGSPPACGEEVEVCARAYQNVMLAPPTLTLPTSGRGTRGATSKGSGVDSLPLRCAPAGNDTKVSVQCHPRRAQRGKGIACRIERALPSPLRGGRKGGGRNVRTLRVERQARRPIQRLICSPAQSVEPPPPRKGEGKGECRLPKAQRMKRLPVSPSPARSPRASGRGSCRPHRIGCRPETTAWRKSPRRCRA